MKESFDEDNIEINAEYVLTDVLDVIFRQLNIKDLSNASLVCKSWREAVLRELAKRGPDIVLIPVSENSTLCQLMSNKPYIALLFVAPLTRQICGIKRDIHESKKDFSSEPFKIINAMYIRLVVKRYKDSCPDYLTAIGVHYAFMDEIDVTITPDLSGSSDRILGLLLPRYKDLKIRVGYHWDFYQMHDIDKLFDDFFPENNVGKSTIILFTQAYEDNSAVTNRIKLRFEKEKSKYTLWGGSFYSGLLPIKNCQIDEESEREFSRYLSDFGANQPNGVFALSISGSNLDSWSTVISCRESKSIIQKRLLDFRESLQLRRRTMGLVCGPGDVYDEESMEGNLLDCHRNPEDFMKAVKKIFPNIPFTGIFDVLPGSLFYGIDSNIDDVDETDLYRTFSEMLQAVKTIFTNISFIGIYTVGQVPIISAGIQKSKTFMRMSYVAYNNFNV